MRQNIITIVLLPIKVGLSKFNTFLVLLCTERPNTYLTSRQKLWPLTVNQVQFKTPPTFSNSCSKLHLQFATSFTFNATQLNSTYEVLNPYWACAETTTLIIKNNSTFSLFRFRTSSPIRPRKCFSIFMINTFPAHCYYVIIIKFNSLIISSYNHTTYKQLVN